MSHFCARADHVRRLARVRQPAVTHSRLKKGLAGHKFQRQPACGWVTYTHHFGRWLFDPHRPWLFGTPFTMSTIVDDRNNLREIAHRAMIERGLDPDFSP